MQARVIGDTSMQRYTRLFGASPVDGVIRDRPNPMRLAATRASLLAALFLAPRIAWSLGDGCGIYVREESQGSREEIFFASYDETLVLMQIDGEVVTLEVSAEESRGQLRELGDVMHRVYASGSTSVQAEFTVTRVCPPTARECDGVGISADFILRKGDATRTFRGTGVSGC
jgi:hypothetical protein